MKQRVYIETTVLSYLAAKPSKDAVTAGRQVLRRRWWDSERSKYEPVVSEAVEVECERRDHQAVGIRRSLLQQASLFPPDREILDLAKVLIASGAIPEKARPDAVHIAAASVARCDFLLTWNFRHIANVRIRREVETILAKHGYTKTKICTPEELI
jgi:hypothetical protein